MDIIGLGKAGCAIADKFKVYPQYKIYKIDTKIQEEDDTYVLEFQNTPEAYEEKLPNLGNTFLKKVKQNVLFITSCGNISGASLRLLSQLHKKKCKITVLYIKPDSMNLSKEKKLQNNLLFNVFQEYARSSVFEKLYLIDNIKMTDIIGDVPVREYFNQINQLISSTMHMTNVFNNQTPVMDTFSKPIDTARISTLGIVDYETGEEKLFFNLDIPREKRYYYAIPETTLESDGTLIKKIKKQVKKNLEHDKINSGYVIHSTDYEQPYICCVSTSTLVQKNEKST